MSLEDAYLEEKVQSTIRIGLTYKSIQENLNTQQKKIKGFNAGQGLGGLVQMTYLKVSYRSNRSSIRFSRYSRRILKFNFFKKIIHPERGRRFSRNNSR